jgi:UDP-GlcNAc3NAcA epimerase
MHWCSVVGARPQFIKLAPVCRAIDAWNSRSERPVRHTIVHTGQHYDPMMSDAHWSALELPAADINLNIGSASHAAQTGEMLVGVERLIMRERYDAVLTYGDTNSTVAAALAAAKLQVPTVHVEAGLRSFDRRMPEEINRIVADNASDLLLAPTRAALDRLAAESLGSKSVFVGDVMLDAIDQYRAQAPSFEELGPEIRPSVPRFGLVTVHRAENTTPAVLESILDGLDRAAQRLELVFPLHPRTAKVIDEAFGDWRSATRVRLTRPLDYLETICLAKAAAIVVTDSGGLQKEAMFLGTPCVTLRDVTEWRETLVVGANRLAGHMASNIARAVDEAIESAAAAGTWLDEIRREYGGGRAAERVVEATVRFLNGKELE